MPTRSEDLAAQRDAYREAYTTGRAAGTLQPGQPPLDPIGRVTPNPTAGLPVPANIPGFKKGGKVRKTGVYKLHKGERVLTARQARNHKSRRARHSRGNITDAP